MSRRFVLVGLGWALIGALGCTNPGEPVGGLPLLDGHWSGTCIGLVGTAHDGREMSVEINGLTRYGPSMPTNIEGELAFYRGDGVIDGGLTSEVGAWECIDERGCMIGDEPYAESELLVQFDTGTRAEPGSGFLYLRRNSVPDSLGGTCLLTRAEGAAFILSGNIALAR